ncbi:MAG TPA: L-seryl-tRNA(Sec) selenium transferase [Acidimicrobiales bacterium]|nr:L-seryl-tRNA(Sec) selenium transferase [Acidimicrobiales bacterium]
MTNAPERPPSVDALARSLHETGLPHPLLVRVARQAIAAGEPASAPARAAAAARALLQPVVNGTGVLLHTNLGRAPAVATSAGTAYSNLELDLGSGRRGSRQDSVGPLLATACGAESAMVVNNCAAAVVLVLATLAGGRGVTVSRGELVEIGGGFRIPEVLASSGATLVEVGTTNRTRIDDHRRAIADPAHDVAVALKVHTSNYRITGFTEDVPLSEMAGLPVPVVADIGSGLLDAATPWLPGGPPSWLAGEPAARQSIEAGAALVTFSGDKLFGGPQAGVIAGRADLVAACARHPLARALRPGGLVLQALQETTLAYLRRDGSAIPLWRMAALPVAELRDRADAVAAGAGGQWAAVGCSSVTGGGTLPGVEIPSAGVARPGDVTAALRAASPPVVARVVDGSTVCDLRTVDPGHDTGLAAALATV